VLDIATNKGTVLVFGNARTVVLILNLSKLDEKGSDS